MRTGQLSLAYHNSLKKHYSFMEQCEVSRYQHIIELDHYIPSLAITLRQAIMHIRSTTINWNLFVAVDTSYTGQFVDFAFRRELREEALNMIAALPLFLEHTLSSYKVWKWFTREARDEADNYKWDDELGVIPKADMDGLNTQLDGWEDLDDGDEAEHEYEGTRLLHTFQLDLEKLGTNTYGDEGSIATRHVIAGAQRCVINAANTNEFQTTADDTSQHSLSQKSNKTSPSNDTLTVTSHSTSTLTNTTDKFSFLKNLGSADDKLALIKKMLEDETMRQTLHLALDELQALNLQEKTEGGAGDES